MDTPTPPENPFESQAPGLSGPAGYGNGNGIEDESLAEGTPDVAAKKGKAFLVLGIVGFIVLFLLYEIFFAGKHKDEVKKLKATPIQKTAELPPLPIEQPVSKNPEIKIMTPTIPSPPELPDTSKLNLNPIAPEKDSAAKQQQQQRLKSNMMVKDDSGSSGGGGLLGGLTGSSTPATAPTDPNSQFALSLANTKAERVEATRIGDLHRTIAQGRFINATMESALNTDLPAPIRAIVSRDVYGEAGNKPLIPKGSRLIGSYNTGLVPGQTRVFVVWTRVIRPDGVDVMLGSPLVDQIGQAGVAGEVDDKFQELFSRALLSSVMNIAVAIGSDKINGGSSTTTTTGSDGGATTQGDAVTTATTNALNRLGSVTDGFIQKFLNVNPTILVDQGTPVNVFVNKDLVFPDDASGTRVIN